MKTSTGNGSTGSCSTGKWSTGNCSTGNGSTGSCSTGNGSTGNWSISDHSTGHFSTIDYLGFSTFNKPCTTGEWSDSIKPDFLYKVNVSLWVSESNMSLEEKRDNPFYETTEGYLKVIPYKEAWKIAWEGASEDDKELLYKLPNFNAEVFKEISGIDINEDKKVTIELTQAQLDKIKHLLGK